MTIKFCKRMRWDKNYCLDKEMTCPYKLKDIKLIKADCGTILGIYSMKIMDCEGFKLREGLEEKLRLTKRR